MNHRKSPRKRQKRSQKTKRRIRQRTNQRRRRLPEPPLKKWRSRTILRTNQLKSPR